MHCQKVWEPDSQTRTSEVSKNALSGILVLLCAEQNVGNFKKMDFQEFWDSCAQSNTSEISRIARSRITILRAQNKTSEVSKNALSKIMGPPCAEQNVGNLNKLYGVHKWSRGA